MNIAILGTRGIPNHYGGFEQFAEHLSVGLVERGHSVTVYNSSLHPYKEKEFHGVTIKHMYDPENKIGTAGQFVYDFLCIMDSRKNNYDVILQLGYTSSSIFFDLHPKSSAVITNMDGLEWKRSKYSPKVQRFLKWAESLAVKKSDFLVSDSVGIQNYIRSKYAKESVYIPYGANVIQEYDEVVCLEYGVKKYEYDMLIARLEPENSIEVILDGVKKSNKKRKFLVIGNHKNKFGEYLKLKFQDEKNIVFVGGVYELSKINSLRYFSNLYFHGHTVGGTNPSLLEAMGAQALVCAHKNEFNSAILGEDGLYFKTADDIKITLQSKDKKNFATFLKNNIEKIRNIYEWKKIIQDYENIFLKSIKSNKS
ncbi:glycosyltransferase family 1 protein [Sulfurimonas crateris]|uniref:Glycosyltransferase family 1 protein n=1 Tax=Sulfurimonas crateris TaxID=2574727 RepID=A0A4V5TM07_9BACT|nr:DUF1972 domain-containing protein [Sulfurimonas crateris]TKI69903.1 glycosyltransferase family 1 protein [Sulfurimonas crateris]